MGLGNKIGSFFGTSSLAVEVTTKSGRHVRVSTEPARPSEGAGTAASTAAPVPAARDEFASASAQPAAPGMPALPSAPDDEGMPLDGQALVQKGVEVLKEKAYAALTRLEDPVVLLELQGIWQQHKLHGVKEKTIESLVQLAEGQKYLEHKIEELDGSIAELQYKAGVAVKHGRDDLARGALEQKVKQQREVNLLKQTVAALQPQIDGLVAAEQAYAQRVKEARDQADLLKIRSHVADAQIRMGEATGDLALDKSGLIGERAKDIIQDKEAKAGAWGDLIASGRLEQVASDLTASEQALDALSLDDAVDQELAKLKGA